MGCKLQVCAARWQRASATRRAPRLNLVGVGPPHQPRQPALAATGSPLADKGTVAFSSS